MPGQQRPIEFEPATINEFAEPSLPSTEELTRQGLHAHDQGQLQEALRCYRLAQQSGSHRHAVVTVGQFVSRLRTTFGGHVLLFAAAELQPDHSPTQQNLGVIYTTQNQPLRALHHFELAQKASPHPMNFVLGANVLPVIYDSMEQLNYWRDG